MWIKDKSTWRRDGGNRIRALIMRVERSHQHTIARIRVGVRFSLSVCQRSKYPTIFLQEGMTGWGWLNQKR